MNRFYEQIYKSSPFTLANLLISLHNIRQYQIRHGGVYQKFLEYFRETEKWTSEEIENERIKRLRQLLLHTYRYSKYYHEKWADLKIDLAHLGWDEFRQLPVITREELQENVRDVYTIHPHKAIKFETGGTTGRTLLACFSPHNVQERFAMVDHFRSRFGFQFGEKTAWFTSKDILTAKDVSKNRFWRTDYKHNIQYYSTFYIQPQNVPYYIDNLNRYQPSFFSGITSSLAEVAQCGLKAGLKLNFKPKAVFPTADMLLKDDRDAMEAFYGCGVYDQYASSEGAPFITQCKNGHMHTELMSGIFEVLDCQQTPVNCGELVVTSFTSEGTPLIRYRIGDLIEMESGPVDCQSNFPIVKTIHGRTNDCVISRETGKLSVVNMVHSVKHVNGVLRFQIIQNELDSIQVKVVKTDEFKIGKDDIWLMKGLRTRLGNEMDIEIDYVDDIPREQNGKFRLIKNYCLEKNHIQ